MAEVILNTTFQIRRGTAAVWKKNNPILARGEPSFVIDEYRLKIGDGITAWNDLPYIGEEIYIGDNKSIVIDGNIVKIKGFDEAAIGAQLVKGEDGALSWIVPDVATMDSLTTTVKNIQVDVSNLQSIVGSVAIGEEPATGIIAQIENISKELAKKVNSDTVYTKVEAKSTLKKVKYDIFNKPDGVLVDYRDKEIRVMFPVDTQWKIQNSGANANASMYYFGFKAYAPDNAVSFKEDTAEIIADNTMYFFEDNDFAGIDEYGRKYSIVWLPCAVYDNETTTWTYYGADSTVNKYIGWYYSVAWYDANGKVISTDTIRINLSNESCHSTIKPFYATDDIIKVIKMNGMELPIVNNTTNIPIASLVSLGVVKGSEEISVTEDGSLSLNAISIHKITQDKEDIIVLNGGSATV